MTWGLVFSAYLGMHIVRRARRVHNSADLVSRLCRQIPYQTSPLADISQPLKLNSEEDPLKNQYKEISNNFEQKVLEVASAYTQSNTQGKGEDIQTIWIPTEAEQIPHQTTKAFSIKVARILEAYTDNKHFGKLLEDLQNNNNPINPPHTQYQLSDAGLLYFVDTRDKHQLCIPKSLQMEIIKEDHDNSSQGAHGGFAKTYYRKVSVYYWPRMAKPIQQYVFSCDICQKARHHWHGPRGYLQPIPVPQQPFKVVSMDLIMDLLQSGAYNAILVIVDKLTKYAHFLPCTTHINEIETAKLFHNHIWCQYSLPRQVTMDRDA
jgi:hypothetical protein